MARTPARSSGIPWKRPNPRLRAGKKSRHLSPAKKTAAKARARRAGRRYPNLVDNMRMASSAKRTGKKAARKTASKRGPAKKSTKKKAARKTTRKRKAVPRTAKSRTARQQDPKGGLTTAGRAAFARRDGSHLKPGVTKKESEMTPQEMRRKGSWAVRFYRRKKLPPLIDRQGRPTRHALSAHAWAEPVPKTIAAARRIAARGERLLAHYRRSKQKG